MFNMHFYSMLPDRVPKEIQAFQGLQAEMEKEYAFFFCLVFFRACSIKEAYGHMSFCTNFTL